MAGNKNSGRKPIVLPETYKKRLTTGEVAVLTGLTSDYIRRLSDRKDGIPHVRLGHNRLFKKEEVLEWLDKQKRNATRHRHATPNSEK